MPDLYAAWMAQLAQNERVMLGIVVATAATMAVVNAAPRRMRLWLLWSLAICMVLSLAVTVLVARPRLAIGMPLSEPLWYDETVTWIMSELPLHRLIAAARGDVHPPLWYLIEAAAAAALRGAPAGLALRLPALLFGALATGLTYRLATSLGHPRPVALTAAALLAVLPGQVMYSQEARMYTLMEASVTLAALGVVTGTRWQTVVGTAAALYTHNTAPAHVIALAALAVVQWRRVMGVQRCGWALAPLGGALAAYAPYVPTLVHQVQQVGGGFWIPQAQTIGTYLMPLVTLWGAGVNPALTTHHTVCMAGLLGLIITRPLRSRLPLVLMAIPPALLAVASELWQPVYLARALIPLLPPFSIAAADALHTLSRRTALPISIAVAAVLATCAASVSRNTDGYATLGEVVSSRCDGGVVYHANLASYVMLRYHAPRCEHVVWTGAGDLSQSLTAETQRAMGITRADVSGLASRRLVVVWVENPTSSAQERDAAHRALASGMATQVWSWQPADLITISVWVVQR